jgi:hypothetical protein
MTGMEFIIEKRGEQGERKNELKKHTVYTA